MSTTTAYHRHEKCVHDNAFKVPQTARLSIVMVDVLSRAPGFAADDVVPIPPEENAFRVDGH